MVAEPGGEGPSEGPSGGPSGGPRSQLKRRMALAQYLLYQLRRSREAYYPEITKRGGHHGGPPAGPQEGGTGDSAADIAAAGAESLADALDPSVPVSALLDSIVSPSTGAAVAASAADAPASPDAAAEAAAAELAAAAEPAAAAEAASWGALARETIAAAGRPPHEALELYLCERLLPVLDSALAALCSFVEQLQADDRQYEQSLQQQQQQQEVAPDQRAHPPCHYLGQGLKDRFDPLVWLAQYLLRQGKAAEEYEEAASACNAATATTATGATAATPVAARPWIRGEHLRHSELPFYSAVAAQVREERGWRAFEALRPQAERIVYSYFEELQQQQQQEGGDDEEPRKNQNQEPQQKEDEQQQEKQQQEPCRLTAEDLPAALQALDAAWGLGEERGLFAAVAAAEGDTDTESSSLPSSYRSGRLSYRLLPVQSRSRSSNNGSSSSIVGACSGVPLEVADSSNITFVELWAFVSSCLQACPPLRQAVFAYALETASNSSSAARQQQHQQHEQQSQQQQQKQQQQQAEQQHDQPELQQGQLQQGHQEQQQQEAEGRQPVASLVCSEGANDNSKEEQQQQ
ncbi:hypothetical protein, conserved [Eimeria acervulina]|uniref:Uncharacterized protein n=1 Tax=Eimeria acervulina TaxID=5801 RepID=U6GGC1_EIMAC|nr:hypothetical protein, conserved [Eimeria acervulina]CDI79301.1 hypothetical protein, conserved [Eimeria acervulina]